MERLSDNVFMHTVMAHGYPVNCAVVVGAERVFVFDTLDSPQAMHPVLDMLQTEAPGRRLMVVNSHYHWDHVYGNAAFAGHDIAAQRLCRRLIVAQGQSESERIPLPPPEGVPLPNISFGERLMVTDERVTVHLLHTPGHTEDSIIMYLDDQDVLFAGDTLEWPFPSLAQRDAGDIYLRTLRRLNQLPLAKVVPGHGPVIGKEIIDHNQRYVEDLYDVVRTAKESRIARADLRLPVEEFAPPGVEIDDVYQRAHQENVEWVYDEV